MEVGPPVGKCVLVTGCFDVLHRGHIALLQFASQMGVLFVGINDDDSVRKLKGPGRPVNCEEDRLLMLRALRCVQRFGGDAFVIRSTNVAEAILEKCPNYWVKGGDYTIETLDQDEVAAANKVGAEIVFFPLVSGYSSTETIRRMRA